MIFAPQHIHDLVRQFRAAKSIPQKLGILLQAPQFEAAIFNPDEATQIWATAYRTGFLELLMNDLMGPMGNKVMFSRFFIAAAHIIEQCVAIGCHATKQPAERRLLVTRIPNIFQRSIAIGKDLSNNKDPGVINDVHMLYQAIISLVAQSFVLVEYDALLVESIEKEQLLRVVLEVAFVQSQHFSPDSMELALDSCARCLSPASFHAYAKKNLHSPIVKEVVARCGPDVIATACASMLLAAEDPVWVNGVANLLVLVHEKSTWTLQKAFVRKGVYKAVVQGFWTASKKPELSGSEISNLATLRAMLLSNLIHDIQDSGLEEQATENTIRLMTDLLEHADFLLFVGKIIIIPGSFLITPNTTFHEFLTSCLRSWNHWIDRACERSPFLVEVACRPAWGHVMRRLLALDRCERPSVQTVGDKETYERISFAIKQWRELGQLLRVYDPTDITDELYWTPRSEEQLPCSWVRCPLSQLRVGTSFQPKWDMLKCTGCRQVQYCGPSCQKRDWESSHRAECSSLNWRSGRMVEGIWLPL